MANAEETRCMLSLFNEQFDSSKKEQIQKFLHDQQELNRRFDEYALHSDGESDESSGGTARDLHKKFSSGISPEELHKNLSKEREDDRDSLDSVLTACAYSSDDDETKRDVTKRDVTKRDVTKRDDRKAAPMTRALRGAERPSRLGRSQSLRVANKVDLSSLRHAPQPPNSPELSQSGDDKPALESLLMGRRASLRENREAKRKQPKKLLTKRTERPKSALGYRTSLSLVDEDAYVEENGFPPPDRPQWDAGKTRAQPANAENSRSAPTYKNRVLNWDTDCPPKTSDVTQTQDQIPDLSTPLDSSRSRGPSYAPAPLPSHPRPHPHNTPHPHPPPDRGSTIVTPTPPDSRGGTFSRNTTVRHSMPIQKRHSDSSMNNKETNAGLKPISRLREFSIPIHEADDGPINGEPATGRMRRFKGHGNLAGPELTPRGTHLAVLKLPPVTNKKKKKTYNNRDVPVRPETSFSFFHGTSETLV